MQLQTRSPTLVCQAPMGNYSAHAGAYHYPRLVPVPAGWEQEPAQPQQPLATPQAWAWGLWRWAQVRPALRPAQGTGCRSRRARAPACRAIVERALARPAAAGQLGGARPGPGFWACGRSPGAAAARGSAERAALGAARPVQELQQGPLYVECSVPAPRPQRRPAAKRQVLALLRRTACSGGLTESTWRQKSSVQCIPH